jgi:integrase/recombinase XerD
MELQQGLSELVEGVTTLLRDNGFSEVTLENYKVSWRQLDKYMHQRPIVAYSEDVGNAFLQEQYGSIPESNLKDRQKNKVLHIKVLSYYQQKGAILRPNKLQPCLNELATGVTALMRAKQFSEVTIQDYRYVWYQLDRYMRHREITNYSEDIGNAFLAEKFGPIPYSSMTENQKKKFHYVRVLGHFQKTQTLLKQNDPKKIIFSGELGAPFNDYLQEIALMNRAEQTLMRYKYYINSLYRDLLKYNMTAAEISIPYLMQFLARLDHAKKPVERNHIISVVRVFIRFLCEKNHLRNNRQEYWMPVLKSRRINSAKLPSVYSAEEVERLISSIDRASSCGKRDYAMILLAARYGLRGTDIIGMRYCNLDWANNQIKLFQHKTGKKIVLPLSEEVGNAIIDYLKFGRPTIDEPYLFITAQAPYEKITKVSLLTSVVSNHMKRSGIGCQDRKHGAHSLRHSLASNLLVLNQPLPVISEVLGHSKTASTLVYLRVDFQQLKQCALEVPYVPSTFYENLYE